MRASPAPAPKSGASAPSFRRAAGIRADDFALLRPSEGRRPSAYKRLTERSDSMSDVSEVLEWHGRTVVDTNGDKLGKIEEIYFDQETNRPEWALINTGMFAGKSSFMPLEGATSDGGQVTAPYSKDQVKDAPRVDPDGVLSQPASRARAAGCLTVTGTRAVASGASAQARAG